MVSAENPLFAPVAARRDLVCRLVITLCCGLLLSACGGGSGGDGGGESATRGGGPSQLEPTDTVQGGGASGTVGGTGTTGHFESVVVIDPALY